MFDRLESSFVQIRRFTAEASHELKTPLSLLRLHAERMVVEGSLTPVQEEAVHAQLDEVTRLNKIIEELLFISRAEAGAITLERKDQDPGSFLQGYAQDARVLSEHRGMHYVDNHSGDGSAFFDAKWIRQVLLNLLSNALKVSPPGGMVTVQSELSGPSWRVSIMDEGPGVEPKSLDRIFERFVRLGPQATEPGGNGGSGLGLAICRSIVELHQGRIWAEAGTDGRGLRVVFELPRQPLATNEMITLARQQANGTIGATDSARHQQWNTD
jgi:signal transduction histidine kinase